MSQGRPRIAPVQAPPEPPAPAASPGAPAARRPWLVFLLLAALLACVAGWALALGQGRELAAALAAQEEALAVREAALAQALSRLADYDDHLGEVRSRVLGLAGELGALEALLERGPGAPPEADAPDR